MQFFLEIAASYHPQYDYSFPPDSSFMRQLHFKYDSHLQRLSSTSLLDMGVVSCAVSVDTDPSAMSDCHRAIPISILK